MRRVPLVIPMLPPLPRFSVAVQGAAFTEQDIMGRLPVAMRRAALIGSEYARGLWLQRAQTMNIRATGTYLRGLESTESIHEVSAGFDGQDYEVVVDVVNVAQHASIVEEGHGAYRLSDRIDWSRTTGRIKRTKKGKPYLHVPFRHAAFETQAKTEAEGLTNATRRAMMPAEIYAMAKRLHRVNQTGGVVRDHSRVYIVGDPDGHHVKVAQFVAAGTYEQPKAKARRRLHRAHVETRIIGGDHRTGGPDAEWAGLFQERRSARLVGRDSNGAALVNPAWTASKFHGLFKTGAKKQTQYMTVRTITPDSTGWAIHAQAGRFVALQVASMLPNDARLSAMVSDAVTAILLGDL